LAEGVVLATRVAEGVLWGSEAMEGEMAEGTASEDWDGGWETERAEERDSTTQDCQTAAAGF